MFSSNGLGDWEVGGKGRGLGTEERDTCYKNPFLFISRAQNNGQQAAGHDDWPNVF